MYLSQTQRKKLQILLVFSITFNCYGFKPWENLPENKNKETYIYVINHGWHTSVIIMQKNLGKELQFLNEDFNNSPYFEIGWGDRGFYEAEEITTKITLEALFIPTPSVLHVVSVPKEPSLYFSDAEVIKIPISKKAHRILNKNISRTFQTDKKGRFIKTKQGLYGHSYFFIAKGTYYITNTCNTWTASVLEDAGLPFSSFLTITASSVINQSRDAVKSYLCCNETSAK